MRRILLLAAAYALVLIFLLSCSKSGNSKGCNITTSTYSTKESGTVTYTVSLVSGSGTVSTITYQGASGMVKVNEPSLPWSSGTLNVQSGVTLVISVVGSTNGTLSAGYQFSGSGNGMDIYQTSQECGH